jgi:hypothetical protein
MNVGSSHTYKTQKVETTEFEDILVKKGIIPERTELQIERATEELQKEFEQAVVNKKESVEKKLEKKSLEEVQELEDELDDDFLRRFRQKRISELQQKAQKEKFGQVFIIQRADFVRHVTEASQESWVVVELYQDGNEQSRLMSEMIQLLAQRQKATKFVRIQSTECVENWPDDHVPCLFLYHQGALQKKVIGLAFCGGKEGATVDKLDWALASYKVFTTSCESDPFLKGISLRRNFVVQHEDDDERSDEDWS